MLKKSVLTKMGCMTCVNIWGETVVYDELTIIERQKDSQFCELLNEVRCGEVSDKTVAILKERVISVSAIPMESIPTFASTAMIFNSSLRAHAMYTRNTCCEPTQ